MDVELMEHPQGDEIRAQVEFYFSDENLAHDEHLLMLCGGSKNNPVSIGEILSWKRMRKFKPRFQVVESLKRSEVLEVLDQKRIMRKVPYQPTWDKHQVTNPLDGGDPVKLAKIPFMPPKKPEVLPPGFEIRKGVVCKIKGDAQQRDYVGGLIEGPLTPQQHAEEYDIYGPGIMVRERLQTAIYRFYTRRKFDADSKKLFNQFMQFGSVDVVPIMFGGSSKQEKEEIKQLDPLLQARMLSIHDLPEEAHNPEMFVMDFPGVAASYLGSLAKREPSDGDVKKSCQIIINFYNYLMLHNVCPEYEAQLLAARKLAQYPAIEQLSLILENSKLLPGPFNKACRLLTTGVQSRDERFSTIASIETAFQRAKKDALSGKLTVPHNWHEQLKVIKVTDVNIEITSLSRPVSQDRNKTVGGGNEPLGRISCTSWDNDLDVLYDVPEDYCISNAVEDFDLFLEDHLLESLRVGMKMEAVVCVVEISGQSLWILDSVQAIYCSFYEPILNELMPKGKSKPVKWRFDVPALGKKAGDLGPLDIPTVK